MAGGREFWFYRFENDQRVWQYGRYRSAGVNWMLKNGWQLFDWKNYKE